MTAQHPRASWSARATALVPSPETAAERDLFADISTQQGADHPDHLARLAIWRDHRAGLISLAEASRRSQNVGREQMAKAERQAAPARPRHTRAAPNESRQYAGDMATTAARDDRLTPNAKAFLQVLRARCGKGHETTITKGTAGNIMARSTRTIRRYLVDLVRFGYVQLAIQRNGRGMHLGLIVTITEKVRPFYEETKGLAAWLAEKPKAAFRPFGGVLSPRRKGVTLLSPKNQTKEFSSTASFGNADTGRSAARDRLMNGVGAIPVPSR
ncbi:helix-turn-helix domain-containing protein [Aureimonas sp. N4]|uniref:helix-turn-helix domain-containing protein n=1 Tax=Aureimonas sp. N4 TaxID=1638165 RepID=UPI000AB11A7E|nr:helix-turn-helix domain-containing protein [Aureimonas sp. N4]